MRLIVYTVAIGDTDIVQAPEVIDPTVKYLCFTDRPCVAPYERIPVPTAEDGSPSSRLYKVLAAHPALEARDGTLYHDASYRLTGSLDWVRRGLEQADLVAMRHPRRTRIEDEGIAIARWGYVTPYEASVMVAGYRAAGYTEDSVTSAGLLGRRTSAAVRRFNEMWWSEIHRWRYRDQVSLDYSAYRTDVTIHHVPGLVKLNPYAAWRKPIALVGSE